MCTFIHSRTPFSTDKWLVGTASSVVLSFVKRLLREILFSICSYLFVLFSDQEFTEIMKLGDPSIEQDQLAGSLLEDPFAFGRFIIPLTLPISSNNELNLLPTQIWDLILVEWSVLNLLIFTTMVSRSERGA